MRKNLYIIALIAIASVVSCSKELDNVQEVSPSKDIVPAGIPLIIKASVDASDTKVSYDEIGKATWTTGDQIAVIYTKTDGGKTYQGWLAYEATTISPNNREATFTLLDGQSAKTTYYNENGYTANGMAVYPISTARPYSATYEETTYTYVNDQEETITAPFVTLGSNGYTSLNDIPLTGLQQADESYLFKTGGSVIKVTVNNVPLSARSLVLQTADKANFPLAGDFILREVDGVMSYNFSTYGVKYVDYFANRLTTSISPASEGASITAYFNIPVGDYNLKNILSLHVLDGSGNCLDTKYIGASLATSRSELLVLPEITLDSWNDIGTSALTDSFHSSYYYMKYAEATLQQSSTNSNKYRVVNPYASFAELNGFSLSGKNPDTYLYFELLDNDKVKFSPFNTDIAVNNKPLVLNYNKWDGTANSTPEYCKVVKKDGENNPLIIQLAPYYCYSDMKNGWSRNNYNDMIRIIFPGYYNHSIAISGDANNMYPALSISGANIASIKYNIQTEENKSRSQDYFKGEYIDIATTPNITIPATTTGTNYLGVKYYDSSNNEVFFMTYPIYHVSDEDLSAMSGTYYIQNRSDWPLTIGASTNILMGNLAFTSYSPWSLTGNIAGVYNGSNSFIVDASQVFTRHSNLNYYGLFNPYNSANTVDNMTFTVSTVDDKKRLAISGISIGIATMSGDRAVSYTATSIYFSASPVLYQQ